MAIIITTMNKLPEHCYECPCQHGESGYCQADKEQRYSDYRPYWCPLKEQEELWKQKLKLLNKRRQTLQNGTGGEVD